MFNINSIVWYLAGEEILAICEPNLTGAQAQELIKLICEKTFLPWPCIYDALHAAMRYN